MGRARTLLLILAALPLLLGGGGPTPLKRGKRSLEHGRYRVAAAAFRTALEADPDQHQAREGLGRALANMGSCEEALVHLGEVRGERAWGPRSAMAEGDCRRRLGDHSGATAALEEALVMNPDLAGAWYQLALVHFARGEACAVCLEALDSNEAGVNRYWIAQAWAALEAGSQDATWELLYELHEQLRITPALSGEVLALLVEALLWLDLDNPVEAERALVRGLDLAPTHLRTTVWLAEAQRRQGSADEAASTLERPFLTQKVPAPLALAITARVRVDQGLLDEAEDLLAQHPEPGDPEYIASRWYLARARGEPAEPPAPRGARHPHQLIPLAEEAP